MSKKQKKTAAPRLRVCLPYPNHGHIHPRTLASVKMLRDCRELRADVVKVRGSSISHARNVGVSGANNRVRQTDFDFDYYLSLDADIEFTVADVLALIRRDAVIVGGAYAMRGKDGHVAAGWLDGNTAEWRYVRGTDSGMVAVDWAGAGFMLVKREVFERLDYPYYREQIINYADAEKNMCAYFVGEDVGFCMAAHKAGYKIYVDCDVKPIHHLTFTGGSTMNSYAMQRAEEMKAQHAKLVSAIGELRGRLADAESEAKKVEGAYFAYMDTAKQPASVSDCAANAASPDSADAIADDINADGESKMGA